MRVFWSKQKADRLAASISQALKDAGLNEGRSVKPSDMLRFGMGLGITLGANGLLGDLGGGGGNGEAVSTGDDSGSGPSSGWQGEKIGATGGAEDSLAPPVVKVCFWCKLSVYCHEISLWSLTRFLPVQSRASCLVIILVRGCHSHEILVTFRFVKPDEQRIGRGPHADMKEIKEALGK